MAIKTIKASGVDSTAAALQIKNELEGFDPKFMLFFASDIYDSTNPARALSEAFPACSVIGSTSKHEYWHDEMNEDTIAVMAMDEGSIEDVCVSVVRGIKSHPDFAADVVKMQDYFGGEDHIFDNFDRYVGLVLFEGSSKAEEYCMGRLGTATDVLFVGGTSSTGKADKSRVYIGSESLEDAMVLALLKTASGYDVLKTQSAELLRPEGHIVTKCDMPTRTTFELDGRPAADVYAEALGIDPADVADRFIQNPVGVLAGDEIFVRTFGELLPGGALVSHCGMPEGTMIHVLKLGDIVEDTRRALDGVITYKPAGVINFNCYYRTLEILNRDVVKEYCEVFGQYNSIGFSTAGEAFLGHINQTSTVLIIK